MLSSWVIILNILHVWCLKIWWFHYHIVVVVISRFFQVTNMNIFAKFTLSPAMSTTSTTTALAAQDLVPSDEVYLLNCMCILVLTRGNGTPFDAASIQGEDIIEICVWLGHTPQRCALVFSNQIICVVSFHGWNAGCSMWGHQSNDFTWRIY